MPKVSVILPVYNVAKYIPTCMEYLLNQTLIDIEIIFVDDCSPDNAVEIIKSYKDPRIKLVRHRKNKYTAEARNSGIKIATGEYLSFIDPDDYPALDMLEKLYNLAKENNADIAKGVMEFLPDHVIRSRNAEISKNKYAFSFMMQTGIYKRDLFTKNKIKFSVDVICGQFPIVYYANKIVTREDAIYYYFSKRPGSCVNSKFTIEKWQRLNITGANKTLDFINKHEMKKEDYIFTAKSIILNLYQYGYKRMSNENKFIAKPLLNEYLDTFWKKFKYKEDLSFKAYYLKVKLQYA